jgi:hypothetical protein
VGAWKETAEEGRKRGREEERKRGGRIIETGVIVSTNADSTDNFDHPTNNIASLPCAENCVQDAGCP